MPWHGQRLAAKLHADGITVVASFVSPYCALREEFNRSGEVLELYVHTTEIRGKEGRFAPDFEPPLANYVDLDRTKVTVASCLARVLPTASAPQS